MPDRKFVPRLLIVGLLLAVAAPVVAASGAPVEQLAAGTVVVGLDGEHLDWPTLVRLVDADAISVHLTDSARARMAETRRGALDAVADGQRVYGWNQALGPLKDRPLDADQQRDFQRRVLRSHAAGVGGPLPAATARLALLLRANSMARAYMGVRPELVDRLLAMADSGVIPALPAVGSLGTGDLQPMAAAGLSMIGENNPVLFHGEKIPAAAAFRAAGLPEQFTMESGEALPLISGSSVLTARYIVEIARAQRDLDNFTAGFALFLEATRAEAGAFDQRTHDERGIPEEVDVARQIRMMVCGSTWMTDEGRRASGEAQPRIQDATSIRATPHILAGIRQTLDAARNTVVREANASTSNPLVFPRPGGGYEFVMGGNWDASEMGHQIDSLNAQMTELGVLADDLSQRLLDPKWSYGLPANLAGGTVGLNSGMVQVATVSTALVPEMQVRANPAGTLSRIVKGGQEDANNMAMASLRNLGANLNRLDTVLGIEAMLSAQGIDLIRPKMADRTVGVGTAAAYAAVRQRISTLTDDRYMTPDVDAAAALMRDGALAETVRSIAACP